MKVKAKTKFVGA